VFLKQGVCYGGCVCVCRFIFCWFKSEYTHTHTHSLATLLCHVRDTCLKFWYFLLTQKRSDGVFEKKCGFEWTIKRRRRWRWPRLLISWLFLIFFRLFLITVKKQRENISNCWTGPIGEWKDGAFVFLPHFIRSQIHRDTLNFFSVQDLQTQTRCPCIVAASLQCRINSVYERFSGGRNSQEPQSVNMEVWATNGDTCTQKNNVLYGSMENHHLLKNHRFVWGAFLGSLCNSLRKWFFNEPWFERFFVEPEMVP